MISNIVRGGAQWWQLKENESSFVKMNQLVQQKYLFQIVKCYKWKEIRNSDHDINRKTSKTVSNFKDNYDSNNLTPRQISYASHSLSTQKIPESLVINLCTVFISTTDQHFFLFKFFHQIKDCCCVKKVLSVFLFLLAAISGHNDFLYYCKTWFHSSVAGCLENWNYYLYSHFSSK